MPVQKEETYFNLIDQIIHLEEESDLAGNATELFRHLLINYFFRRDISSSKSFQLFLENIDMPGVFANAGSLLKVDIENLRSAIEGGTVNDSLAGSIMLSKEYLKAFYSNHPPAFGKLPHDVQADLVAKIKNKNQTIVSAFEKINEDIRADKKRKILNLIALVIKNIHFRTGRPINKLPGTAEEIIRSLYSNADEIFNGSQKQMTLLKDDVVLKQLIKAFFTIRQFSEITDLSNQYKKELERYRKRAIFAAENS